ncbi:cytochrome c-type biogenesis CcmH-like mitochondrial protein [Tanacetum coccineum]
MGTSGLARSEHRTLDLCLQRQWDVNKCQYHWKRTWFGSFVWTMENEEDPVKKQQIIDARARNISHNVRCLECGSQSIEESQADIAVLLRKLRNELKYVQSGVKMNEISCLKVRHVEHKIWETRTIPHRSKCELIRDEIRSGKSDKDIYHKLEEDYGETILYAPKFDWQTAGLWLSPLIVAGAAGGIWAYGRHRQRTNVHLLAINLTRGIPFTPKEKATMIEILTPPPQGILSSSPWWKQWLPR